MAAQPVEAELRGGGARVVVEEIRKGERRAVRRRLAAPKGASFKGTRFFWTR